MIKFRQKNYTGSTKSTVKVVKKFISDHPVIPISTLGVGISGTNLAVNASRQKEAREYQEKQLRAMNNLTTALTDVDKSLKETKRVEKPEPKSVEKKIDLKKFRLFSIEDGGYKGDKRVPGKGGYLGGTLAGSAVGAGLGGVLAMGTNSGIGKAALIGSVIGAGVGALATWLNNLADKSIFNTGKSTNANSYNLVQGIEDHYKESSPDEEETTITSTETTENGRTVSRSHRVQTNKRETVSPKGIVYEIDADPKKYSISVLYRGNVLMMYVNGLSRQELGSLNNILDHYCHSYKNADYLSNKVSKNVYVVEVCVIKGTENDIVMKMIESGFKINILTGNKFKR